jgi:hypothetical protein
MAKKTILVSDLSGREIDTARESVRITVTFGDAGKPQYVVDAHPDDPEVQRLLERGKKQARRGRQPKATA